MREHFDFREAIIAKMNGLHAQPQTFPVYYGDVTGFPARCGATRWSETADAWIEGPYWAPNGPASGTVFLQKGSSAYDSVVSALPYGGECLGAVQLCVLSAAAAVLHKPRFNALHTGQVVLGDAADGHHNEYDRHINGAFTDGVTYIPGDILYMDNHDYDEERGPWQGENCVIVDIDPLVHTPFYSGLGEECGRVTEDELRGVLKRHYEIDCAPSIVPTPVEHYIRFVGNARPTLVP